MIQSLELEAALNCGGAGTERDSDRREREGGGARLWAGCGAGPPGAGVLGVHSLALQDATREQKGRSWGRGVSGEAQTDYIGVKNKVDIGASPAYF